MSKAPELKLIEEAFTSIKAKPKGDHDKELEIIRRVLSRRYDLKFQINIVENASKQFYGMSVFPEEDTIDKMIEAMLTGKNRFDTIAEIWAKNKHWVIDIDSMLLYDTTINANPAEITAVMLHELGHVIKSNSVPERVYRIVNLSKMRMSMDVKRILGWDKARKIIGLTILEGCAGTNYHTNLKHEAEADMFAMKEGYGEDLAQFIDKIIKKKGNKLVDRPETELDQEVETVLQWALGNVSQLEYRKNVLDRNLQSQMLMTKSPFVRGYLKNIRDAFFGKSDDRFERMVKEQRVMNEYKKYTVVTEAFKDFFNKNGRVQKVTSQDIDLIMIEANRIQNENDRIYVLDLIYDKLDIIELSMDLLKNSDTAQRVQVSKDTLKRQKEELLNLRRQVMTIKIRPKDTSLLISYPEGYEG